MDKITFIRDFFMDLENQSSEKFSSLRDNFMLIGQASEEFLNAETKARAMVVFNMFFDFYKMKYGNGLNFVDLLDVLKEYEERASVLLDKQRDHYIHSVNVFLLGIFVYESSDVFASNYKSFINLKDDFEAKTRFFYEWGITALCHDIGYPYEISYKQVERFSSLITRKGHTQEDLKPYLGFKNFDVLNMHKVSTELAEFEMGIGNETLQNSSDVLGMYISKVFGINQERITRDILTYLNRMQMYGFVDHAYFSTMIVMKWYRALIEAGEFDKSIWDTSIVPASTAIFLHNFYKHGLMKDPYGLTRLNVDTHPLSYLLILCDELQDWNRPGYGKLDQDKAQPEKSSLTFENGKIQVDYHTFNKELSQNFRDKKTKDIVEVLNVEQLYPNGFEVNVKTRVDLFIEKVRTEDMGLTPRLILDNFIELGKKIHEDYNRTVLEQKQLDKYCEWDELSLRKKLSSIKQAYDIPVKVKRFNYAIMEFNTEYPEVTGFSTIEIELLAKMEHNRWLNEKTDDGWTFGVSENTTTKTHPCIIPYEELTEEEKNKDRNAVKNIIPLLNSVGLHLYKARKN